MRTIEAIEDLLTGIIFRMNLGSSTERDTAKEIIRALTEENNLNIPPVIKLVCGACGCEKTITEERCSDCGYSIT